MSDSRICEVCEQTSIGPDVYVCPRCASTLSGLLTGLASKFDDLDAAIGRQLRFTGRVGAASTETTLPINLAASEAGWVARQTLLTWVDWVSAVRGELAPVGWDEVEAYLVGKVRWLVQHPGGAKAIDEMIAALRQARRAVDRPQERKYLGLCRPDYDDLDRCVQAIYAPAAQIAARCPRCGVEHQVQDLLERMQRRVAGVKLTAADAERLLAEVGIRISADLIRQWRKRREVEPVGATAQGRPVYLLGDLLDRHAGGARHGA